LGIKDWTKSQSEGGATRMRNVGANQGKRTQQKRNRRGRGKSTHMKSSGGKKNGGWKTRVGVVVRIGKREAVSKKYK